VSERRAKADARRGRDALIAARILEQFLNLCGDSLSEDEKRTFDLELFKARSMAIYEKAATLADFYPDRPCDANGRLLERMKAAQNDTTRVGQ